MPVPHAAAHADAYTKAVLSQADQHAGTVRNAGAVCNASTADGHAGAPHIDAGSNRDSDPGPAADIDAGPANADSGSANPDTCSAYGYVSAAYVRTAHGSAHSYAFSAGSAFTNPAAADIGANANASTTSATSAASCAANTRAASAADYRQSRSDVPLRAWPRWAPRQDRATFGSPVAGAAETGPRRHADDAERQLRTDCA